MLEPLAHCEEQGTVHEAITEMIKLNAEMETRQVQGLNIVKHIKAAQ